MKINELAQSKNTKLVIFIVRSDDKCLTLTVTSRGLTLTKHWKPMFSSTVMILSQSDIRS